MDTPDKEPDKLDCMEMTPAESRAALKEQPPQDDWHCRICNAVRGFNKWSDDPTLCLKCATSPSRDVWNAGQ